GAALVVLECLDPVQTGVGPQVETTGDDQEQDQQDHQGVTDTSPASLFGPTFDPPTVVHAPRAVGTALLRGTLRRGLIGGRESSGPAHGPLFGLAGAIQFLELVRPLGVTTAAEHACPVVLSG